MLFRMIMENKVSGDWFGCVLVISFYVAKVFSDNYVVVLIIINKDSACKLFKLVRLPFTTVIFK